VHPSERLAALLAGELSADETRALEAELARDPELRAQLAAMRRADAALEGEPASELPAGAEDRLLAALGPTFDEVLGGEASQDDPQVDPRGAAPAGPGATDELAARRAARPTSRRTWLTAVGGVAAAVAAVAIVLPNLTGTGGDDAAEVTTAAGPETETFDADDAADGEAGLPAGPTVLGGDRELDAEDADALLDGAELTALAAAGLAPDEATTLGQDWATRLGAPIAAAESAPAPDADVAEDEAAEEQAPADDSDAAGEAGRATGEVIVGPDVDDAALDDVGRCLGALLVTGDVVVPVTAELVVFDDEPAVAFGLVGRDGDGEVQRREVWVLDRASCEVRYFGQR
jgi:hypothetical protein